METIADSLTGRYDIDPVHSTVHFAMTHMVSTFRATFHVQGHLVVTDDRNELRATARVDSVSIGEPLEFRQHVLEGDDFFLAGVYPEIAFHSTDIALGDDGEAVVTGELTIRDTTQTITAVGSYRGPRCDPFGNERVGLQLRTSIDRRDWGFNWQLALPQGGDALGWDVQLSAELELVGRDSQ